MPAPLPAPSLAELQRAFAATLAGADDTRLLPWIAARGIEPAARLHIYRHAGYAIHVDALLTSFPALQRLLGASCFDALATRHAAHHGSRSGNLQDYGADFAEYLVAQAETAAMPWLAELARLEWLRQRVALSADAPAADADTLVAGLGQGILRLRPCVRVLASSCAVFDLWHHAQTSAVGAIDLAVPQTVLLWREGPQVAMRAIAPAQAAFIQALQRAAPLDQALAAALAVEACAGPESLLRPLLEHALIAAGPVTPENEEPA